jgi:hypothetical protein
VILRKSVLKKNFSILGIDPTFHFGDFDVTVTTYRHQMLEENTPGKHMLNRHPVFVGPVCIHKKKIHNLITIFYPHLLLRTMN